MKNLFLFLTVGILVAACGSQGDVKSDQPVANSSSDISPIVTKEELVKWLDSNVGDWAGISARNGVIVAFDHETGQPIATINVDPIETEIENFVSVSFVGEDLEKVKAANQAYYTWMVDGGLDQNIEGTLGELGHNVSIGEYKGNTQYFQVD